jgi:transposase-like protein
MDKRDFTSEFKARIIIEVLEGAKQANEIAAREEISPKQLSNWKCEFLSNAHRAFSIKKDERQANNELKATQEREQELMAKVGQLAIENDWLKKKSKQVLGYDPTIKPNLKRR